MQNLRELETEARRLARQNRTTYEGEYAALLEENPDIYAAYRAKHNVRALTGALEAAGYKLVPR